MSHQPLTNTLSIRIRPKIGEQLSKLANATGRTKSFLAAEAIESYLKIQSWQITAIESAVKKANSKNVKLIEHKKVTDWLNSWGTENEQAPPE